MLHDRSGCPGIAVRVDVRVRELLSVQLCRARIKLITQPEVECEAIRGANVVLRIEAERVIGPVRVAIRADGPKIPEWKWNSSEQYAWAAELNLSADAVCPSGSGTDDLVKPIEQNSKLNGVFAFRIEHVFIQGVNILPL